MLIWSVQTKNYEQLPTRWHLKTALQEEIHKNMKFSNIGAEATCVEIATEMQKYFRLKDMLNFNVLWNFQAI